MDQQEIANHFGRALRLERKRLGLTQTEVADRIGTSQQNVAGWEAGRAMPRQEMMAKVLQFFGQKSSLAQLPDRELLPSTLRLMQALANVKPAPAIDFSEQEVAAASEDELREALPVELHQYLDKPLRNRTIDYCSDKLAMEIVRARSHTDTLMTRGTLALHRLTVLRRIREREGLPALAHVYLALLFTDSLVRVQPGGPVQQLQDEAALLGVECLSTHSARDLALFIMHTETGERGPEWGSW